MKWGMALAGLVLTVTACSDPEAASEEGGGTPVALVTLSPVRAGAIEETVMLYGVAEGGAAGRAGLSAPAEGIIAGIDAPAGSTVSAGQVVARLAPSPASRLDLAKATSDARAADAALARAERLRAGGLASDADVESARAAAQSADAALRAFSRRNGAFVLRAPFAGHVDAISQNPGDLVAAGVQVAILSRGGAARAHFGIAPGLARRLAPGRTVQVAPAGGGRAVAVPVASVNPTVDAQTHLASVYAVLPASAGIGIGEPLSGRIAMGGAGKGVSIPYAALLDDAGQPFVFTVSGGVAHRRDIETGAVDGGRVAVPKGLKAGEQVVTAGGTAIEDGMKVRTR